MLIKRTIGILDHSNHQKVKNLNSFESREGGEVSKHRVNKQPTIFSNSYWAVSAEPHRQSKGTSSELRKRGGFIGRLSIKAP